MSLAESLAGCGRSCGGGPLGGGGVDEVRGRRGNSRCAGLGGRE